MIKGVVDLWFADIIKEKVKFDILIYVTGFSAIYALYDRFIRQRLLTRLKVFSKFIRIDNFIFIAALMIYVVFLIIVFCKYLFQLL